VCIIVWKVGVNGTNEARAVFLLGFGTKSQIPGPGPVSCCQAIFKVDHKFNGLVIETVYTSPWCSLWSLRIFEESYKTTIEPTSCQTVMVDTSTQGASRLNISSSSILLQLCNEAQNPPSKRSTHSARYWKQQVSTSSLNQNQNQ
jgi:hypothetical protein